MQVAEKVIRVTRGPRSQDHRCRGLDVTLRYASAASPRSSKRSLALTFRSTLSATCWIPIPWVPSRAPPTRRDQGLFRHSRKVRGSAPARTPSHLGAFMKPAVSDLRVRPRVGRRRRRPPRRALPNAAHADTIQPSDIGTLKTQVDDLRKEVVQLRGRFDSAQSAAASVADSPARKAVEAPSSAPANDAMAHAAPSTATRFSRSSTSARKTKTRSARKSNRSSSSTGWNRG
mgnify:CR=1 FL=1